MNVCAITGVSGYLGQRLVSALADDPAVERMVGIDIRPPPLQPAKMTFVRMDVRDPALGGLLRREGVTVLLHLAFIVQAIHDERLMHDVNVGGAANVLRAAADAAIRQIVMLSSYTVYGAWPDNPPLLTEGASLRPNPGHAYAEHKVAVERLCDEFEAGHPHIALARLRPAVIMGPHCDNGLGRALRRAPLLPVFAGGGSAVQFVHEEDLVAACLAVLQQGARGVYNVGGEGSLPWGEIVRRAGKLSLPLPAPLLQGFVGLLWRLHVPGLTAPGELPLIRYRLVVSSEKAQRELGWRPRYTTAGALESFLGSQVAKGAMSQGSRSPE
ncbi:MAG: NAD-dependent epimerase/dehydratase family protein [Anaerolineae bacterium]|nr:NAD-dependent epimerase/dehydratase family protein [Anaerolineae bacterium]